MGLSEMIHKIRKKINKFNDANKNHIFNVLKENSNVVMLAKHNQLMNVPGRV